MKILRLRVNQISPFAYAYVTVAVQMRTFCPFVYALANPNDDVFAFVFRMFTWLLIVSYPSRLAYVLLSTACVSSFRWAQLWHSDAENVWHPLPWYVLSVLFAFELARRVGAHYVRALRLLVFVRLLSARFPVLANSATILELLATLWYTGNQRFCVSLRNYPAVLVFALVAAVVMHVQATMYRDVVEPHCDHTRRVHTSYPRNLTDLVAVVERNEMLHVVHSGSCDNTGARHVVSSRFLDACEGNESRMYCLVGAHPKNLGYTTAASLRSIGSVLDGPLDASGARIADRAIAYTVARDAQLLNVSADARRTTDTVIGVWAELLDAHVQKLDELHVPDATVDWESRTLRNVPLMCGRRPELLLTARGVHCPARAGSTPRTPVHPMLVELADTVLPLVAFGVELCARLFGMSLYELSDGLHRRSYEDADWQFDVLNRRSWVALQLTATDNVECMQDVLRYTRRHVVLQCVRPTEASTECAITKTTTVHFVFMPATC